MKTAAELACIKAEVEYQEWRECPQWYCVKTTYHNTGEIESEIMCEKKKQISRLQFSPTKSRMMGF